MTGRPFDVAVIGGGIVGTAIASGLAARGVTVAVIEAGPQSIRFQKLATPPVICRYRRHEGCVSARNHVLGGNGHYWGGGLIRPPRLSFAECVGLPDGGSAQTHADLERHFEAVERQLGLRRPPGRSPLTTLNLSDDRYQVAEMCVLPGGKRNVSRIFLDAIRRSANCEIFPASEVLAFEQAGDGHFGRRIRQVTIRHKNDQREVPARAFVIAAGAVDSNVLVQRFADQLQPKQAVDTLGRRMHDHWSVPLASFRMIDAEHLRTFLAPLFDARVIVGRRIELPGGAGWGARGFLHFTFAFDELSPYREIKRLMKIRQEGASIVELLTPVFPLLAQPLKIARIGMERLLRGRLHLPSGLRITATLDFESFPHLDNVLRLNGEHVDFDWHLSAEDEKAFIGHLGNCRALFKTFEERFRLRLDPLFDLTSRSSTLEHLHNAATDAFHLGGGLAVGSATDAELRLVGTENVFVISTATFTRPGIVNPTLALLAMAQRFVAAYRKD